ncbi:Bgt-51080 [Blumeria graminis f. sp. tritici]|uniref:Bgt-51080 n=1 Tax=Blumeria graminis f. sp. tritici TaxID=62690 RepID=A0A9X9MJ06_BLUGR|nr:Bgt-51080 [Blumeria graminis f. sp. tritici]
MLLDEIKRHNTYLTLVPFILH